MPKGYWVTTYRSIYGPDKLAAYAKLAPVALAPFGVKYIVRGAAAAASEAGIKQRVVISVFDRLAKAIAAHDSAAYQSAVTPFRLDQLPQHRGLILAVPLPKGRGASARVISERRTKVSY